MLAKQKRLTKKKDFEKIYRKGKTVKNDFLVLKTASNNLTINRFAFVVSQKISKKAVVRNKIKRRLRELVRLNINKMGAGRDFVFIALPGIEKKDFKQIKEAFEGLLLKRKIFN